MTQGNAAGDHQRVNILGVGVSAINMHQALAVLTDCIEQRQRCYVVVCPVYTVMLCQSRPDLRRVVNEAALVTPDGMPLVFLSRWLGYSQVDRVYGPDLMLAFSQMAAARGYSSFYYGGGDGVAARLGEVLARRFPGLHTAGAYSPPFREEAEPEDPAIIQMINAAQPDVIWVGLGSPKQEYWMARHRPLLDAPVLIGVGAAFDIHTGRVAQAPRWMQRSALEWLFRLLQEPQRLWRRYLVYNPLFVIQVLLQLLGLRHPPDLTASATLEPAHPVERTQRHDQSHP
ncbi:MAG: WecB/TagA/CpsF family glycosyltransferase [Anaerolineae bacterium]